ncbi:polypeptide HsdS [Streptomyces glebosus]|uniref:Polypeptide HsdS n=1 Tax=Streptomyces glebosus TaxID=249580 RepID=A0A640SSM3_9ACTN|nr:restriction endonuclease subunit S [Streptomyces glebosus]GFE13842.1 polypeptide HsdS [Streptomyces glebosus]GHG82467.1 polypeptide HsdS [Streptomyces glebosus]
MTISFDGLPSHWDTTRLDWVATVNARIGWKALTAAEYQDSGYAFLSTPNIKGREIDFTNVNYISDFRYRESPELQLAEGDVLLTKDGFTLGTVNVVRHLPRPATVNGSIAVLRSFGIHPRFLYYVIASSVIQGHIWSVKDGMDVLHLFQRDIKKFPIPLPPREEQRRIADFLDAETARIDNLVAARKRHVGLLCERWESVIHHELTRGGVEEVELRRLGVAVTTGPFGTAFNASEYRDGGIPMVNPLHIKGGRITPDRHHAVSPSTAARLSRHQLRAGDLVVGRKGDLGRAALVDDDQDGWVCGSDCIAVHPSSMLRPQFLAQVLRSQYVREQLLARSLAATMPSLSEGNLLSLRIPNFTLEQQDAATARLAVAHGWHDRAVAAMARQLKLLAERRQALITAAVTGQFDVSTASGRNVTDGVTV